MWLILSMLIAAGVIVMMILIVRKIGTDRKRSTTWNNLHERGKLMATQLEVLREKSAQRRDESKSAKLPPDEELSAKSRSFWPRRTSELRIHRMPMPTSLSTSLEYI